MRDPEQTPSDEVDGRTYRLMRPAAPPEKSRRAGSEPPPKHPLYQIFFGKLPLETESTVFILVNLLDFFVTYFLLMAGARGNLRFVESNPVAQYFIDSWGPVKGMLGFKLSVVTFVCLLVQLIAMKRMELARAVLLIGIIATGAVVAYSVSLWMRHA